MGNILSEVPLIISVGKSICATCVSLLESVNASVLVKPPITNTAALNRFSSDNRDEMPEAPKLAPRYANEDVFKSVRVVK